MFGQGNNSYYYLDRTLSYLEPTYYGLQSKVISSDYLALVLLIWCYCQHYPRLCQSKNLRRQSSGTSLTMDIHNSRANHIFFINRPGINLIKDYRSRPLKKQALVQAKVIRSDRLPWFRSISNTTIFKELIFLYRQLFNFNIYFRLITSRAHYKSTVGSNYKYMSINHSKQIITLTIRRILQVDT